MKEPNMQEIYQALREMNHEVLGKTHFVNQEQYAQDYKNKLVEYIQGIFGEIPVSVDTNCDINDGGSPQGLPC